MTTTDLASHFMRVFSGLERAYGTYDLNNPVIREDGKRQGAALTYPHPITLELWEDHLTGKNAGIGITPIKDGNTCFFGAIDIDQYQNFDLRQIVFKVQKHQLPLIVCRSKSGGAHVYCFAKVAVPASTMKRKLSEVAAFLGFGGSEIFPKQTHIISEKGDVGSWINMPYYNGVKGLRYAIDKDGNALSPEAFLLAVQSLSVSESWFDELLIMSNEFDDGPPCLQNLAQVGYPVGTRNDGLYNIGVYLKKAFPDAWETKLDEFNHKYMQPPLTLAEVQGLVKSLKRKDYMYGCSKQPIAQYCNATLCRTRKHGVGHGGGRFPMLGGLTKLNTKPPIWFWTIDGVRMELSTADIQDPRKFQARCMEYINMMPELPSGPVWQAAVQHAMDTVTVMDAPSDASPEGQFWEWLEKFCTGRAQALALDEMVLGKPYTEKSRTNFRMQDLLRFLTNNKFFEFKSTKIAAILKEAGAEHHFSHLKGRGVNYWSIPEFAKQNKPFDLPESVSDEDKPF